jgi:biotin carboxylase
VIIVPYANGAASPTEIARACVPFGGAVFVVDGHDGATAPIQVVLEALGRVALTANAAEVAAVLAGEPADGIVTFADTTIDATLDLSEAFRLPYHSRATAQYLTDKLAQRKRLNSAGVGYVPVEEIVVGSGAVAPNTVVFPAVVKPRRGSGSEHTVIVRGAALFGANTAMLDPSRSYIAERYIEDGPAPAEWLANYLSVESVVRGADIVHLGITGRLPLSEPARETGAIFPLTVPADQHAELTQFAEQAIHALDIRLGIVHTEIKLAPNGPQVIEVNGRLGGRLNQLMTMVGMTPPVSTAVGVAAGRPLPEAAVVTGTAVSFWLQPPVWATRVHTLPAVRDLTALPGVVSAKQIRSPGSPVDWRTGSGGLALELWLHAVDQDELFEIYQTARSIIDSSVSWE